MIYEFTPACLPAVWCDFRSPERQFEWRNMLTLSATKL